MTSAIADTDILSTFGKLERVDLLHTLFPKIYVAPAVHKELGTVERLGFAWARSVREAIELLSPAKDEVEKIEHLSVSYPQLGAGEIETLVLANTHRLLCLTNDRQAKATCRALNCAYLDLEDVLRAFKLKGILTVAALSRLMEQIEEKDRTRIKAKDQILKK
jgi:predicted nucleic acid-binding protein